MRRLTLVSGPAWPLGTRVRGWIELQPKHVPIDFLAPGSAALLARFPGIAPAPEDELVAVSDDGAVWRGDKAWVMTLWAMRRWRPWALKLAAPARLPHARRFVRGVADGRSAPASADSVTPGSEPIAGPLFFGIAAVLAVLPWLAASVLGFGFPALIAIALFWVGGSRGFVAATALLILAAVLIDLDASATGLYLGWGTLVTFGFLGLPVLFAVARLCRLPDSTSWPRPVRPPARREPNRIAPPPA